MTFRSTLGIAIGFAFLATAWSQTPQASSLTIAEVMREAHKKPHELLKKTATGKASAQQQERLLELYQALSKLTPPKGNAKSWQAKTEALVSAAKAAVEGKADAGKQLSRAANCRACHQDHK